LQASREDELSAAAGDPIIIAGEYKNPGWVWASHVGLNGQAAGDYRLCPANYFSLLQPPPSSLQNHVQGPLSPLRARARGNASGGLEAENRAGGASALPGARATPEITHALSSLSARDRKPASISAARLTLQQTHDFLTYDAASIYEPPSYDAASIYEPPSYDAASIYEPPSYDSASIYEPPSSGFGVLPREEIMMIRESLVDMDDPILDGMFEDEAGRISVQC